MKQENMSPQYKQILKCFAYLPQKILSFNGVDNVTEFVLHSLCNENCLNLSKAAYFIDNPDFDCLKGVAGFDKQNEFVNRENIWGIPDHFTKHMQSCNFNQKVRNIYKPSAKRANLAEHELIERLSNELTIEDPHCYAWNGKHNNHALVIFECAGQNSPVLEDDIVHGLCLLGFCPLF